MTDEELDDHLDHPPAMMPLHPGPVVEHLAQPGGYPLCGAMLEGPYPLDAPVVRCLPCLAELARKVRLDGCGE